MPRIDISIRRKRSHHSTSDQAKGVIDTQPRAETFERRIRGFMNFYDLGQKWNGSSWQDLDFQDVRSLTLGLSPPRPIGTMAFGSTGWDNLKAKIFEVDISDWKSTYRPLDYTRAEQYYVDIYTGVPGTVFDPYPDHSARYSLGRAGSRSDIFGSGSITGHGWTNKGLKIDADPNDNFYVLAGGLFPGIPTSNVKVTNTPVYTDPSATVNIGKKADVYLVPWPIINQGSDGSTFILGNYEGFLNLFFEVLPRSLILDNTEASPLIATAPGRSAYSMATYPLTVAAAIAYVQNRPNARYYYKGTGFVSPSGYPTNPSRFDINLATFTINNFGGGSVSLEPGSLLAVVRTSNQDFYFWSSAHVAIPVNGIRFTQ